MANVDSDLEKEGYVKWVETGTCLGFVKKGLEKFANNRSMSMQQGVKYKATGTGSFHALCPGAGIEPRKKTINGKLQWTMSCYTTDGCTDCQTYIETLDNLCVPPFKLTKAQFGNTDIHLWPTDIKHWNMAKIFMNPDASTGPEDTDLSNILNFIMHCRVPYDAISNKHNLERVRECRNSIMHSSTFTVDDPTFQTYTSSMTDLLEDQRFLDGDKDATEAAVKVKEIQTSKNFTITTDAEFRVLRDRALELRKENTAMKDAVENLKAECEELEAKDDEQSKMELAELVKEIDEKQTSLEQLESTWHKLYSFASRKPDLHDKMKSYAEDARDPLEKTKECLTEVRNKYKPGAIQTNEESNNELDQYLTDKERYESEKERSRSLMTDNEGLKAEIQSLRENIDSTKTNSEHQIAELEKTLQEAKTTNENLAGKVEETTNKNKELLSKLTECENKIKELETKIESSDNYAKQLQNEIDMNKQELEKVLAENTDLKKEKAELASTNADYKIYFNKLQQKAETLSQQLEDSKLRNDKLEKQLQIQESELKNHNTTTKLLAENNSAMKMKIDQMNSELAEKGSLIQNLNLSIQQLLLANENLESKVAAAKLIEKEFKEVKLDVSDLITDTKNLIKAKTRQDSIIFKYKRVNSQIHAELKMIKIENKNKLKELQKAYNDIECLQHKINDLMIEAEQKCKDIQSLNGRIYTLEKELESKNMHLTDLQTDILTLKDDLEIYKTNLKASNNDLIQKKGIIKMFRKDVDAVAELKKDNDRLRKTDTTLFRIWCLAVILFVAVNTIGLVFRELE